MPTVRKPNLTAKVIQGIKILRPHIDYWVAGFPLEKMPPPLTQKEIDLVNLAIKHLDSLVIWKEASLAANKPDPLRQYAERKKAGIEPGLPELGPVEHSGEFNACD